MHKFLRAIGFSDITKKDLEMILDEVITRPEIMKITKDSEGNEFAELSGSFAANAGITVRGTYQEDDSFHMDYYYPYVFGTSITTNEQMIEGCQDNSFSPDLIRWIELRYFTLVQDVLHDLKCLL